MRRDRRVIAVLHRPHRPYDHRRKIFFFPEEEGRRTGAGRDVEGRGGPVRDGQVRTGPLRGDPAMRPARRLNTTVGRRPSAFGSVNTTARLLPSALGRSLRRLVRRWRRRQQAAQDRASVASAPAACAGGCGHRASAAAACAGGCGHRASATAACAGGCGHRASAAAACAGGCGHRASAAAALHGRLRPSGSSLHRIVRRRGGRQEAKQAGEAWALTISSRTESWCVRRLAPLSRTGPPRPSTPHPAPVRLPLLLPISDL